MPRPYYRPAAPFPVAPSLGSSDDGLVIDNLHVAGRYLFGDERAHDPLLLGDARAGVHDLEAEFLDDFIILVEDLALEQAEALDRIRAPSQVNPRLVEFHLDAPRHQAIHRY